MGLLDASGKPVEPQRRQLARVRWYHLATAPTAIAAIPGLIYSTGPRCAQTKKGDLVVCKTPNDVIAAECAGHALAELVGIETVRWGVARAGAELVFISEYQEHRDVLPFLEARVATNRDLLDRLLVFDVWVANIDRNEGSLVGRAAVSQKAGFIELLPIDVERAQLLREVSIFTVTETSVREMLPRGRLLHHLPKDGPTIDRMIQRIGGLSAQDIRDSLDRMRVPDGSLISDVPMLDLDKAVHALQSRARQLPRLITEALEHV